MNNKGFAITGILYTILIMFLVFISMMLFNLQNRKTILDELKVDAVNAVESDNNYEYLLNEINSLKSQIGSSDISSIGGTITGAVSSLNSSFSWKFLKTVTGNTKIQLPDSYNEIIVDIENEVNYFSINLSRAQLSSSAKHYREGYYMNSSGASALATITATESSIFLNFLMLGSENATASSKVSVYYR